MSLFKPSPIEIAFDPKVKTGRSRLPLRLLAEVALITLLTALVLGWLYQAGFSQRIEVGKTYARSYLSAFAPPAATETAYRWTTDHSVVVLPPVGYPYQLTFQAASRRPVGAPLPQVSVRANRVLLAQFQAANTSQVYTFEVSAPYLGPGALTIEFDSETFQAAPGQPPVGIALEWLEVRALTPTLPPPFGAAALIGAFSLFYVLWRLTFNRAVAVVSYGLALGLFALLLREENSTLLVREHLLPVAGLVVGLGWLGWLWVRLPRYRAALVGLLGFGWVLASLFFYFWPGVSEPLAWRRVGLNWSELSVIFSGLPRGILLPILALLIALSAGLVVDGLLSLGGRRWKVTLWQNWPERVAISGALGLAGLSWLVFALGVLGLLYGVVLWGLVGLMGVAALVRVIVAQPWRLLSQQRPKLRWHFEPGQWLFWAGAGGIFALFTWLFLSGALSPDFGYDAVWYHLTQARYYNEQHRLVNLVAEYGLWPAAYPSNQEMLYALAYGLVPGTALAQAFHWLDGLGLALAVYLLARRYLSRRFAVVAALLCYCGPLVEGVIWTANNDLTLALYFVLSLYALLRFLEAPSRHEGWVWLSLAGVLGGYLCGIKHLGMVATGLLLSLLLIYLGWPLLAKRPVLPAVIAGPQPGRLMLLAVGFYAGLAGLLVLPWLGRAALEQGNPFYPALSPGLFSGQWWDSGANGLFVSVMGEKGLGRDFSNFLFLPWTIPTNPKAFDGSSGSLFLVFVPLGLLALLYSAHLRRPMLILVALSLGYTAAWFYLGQHVRYLLPVYALLAIVAAYGLSEMLAVTPGRWLKAFWPVLVVALLLLNLPFFSNLRREYNYLREYNYVYGQESYEQMMRRRLDKPVAWLNGRLPASARVATVYYAEQDFYSRPVLLRVRHGLPNADYRLDPTTLQQASSIASLHNIRATHLVFETRYRSQVEQGPLGPHLSHLEDLADPALSLYAFNN